MLAPYRERQGTDHGQDPPSQASAGRQLVLNAYFDGLAFRFARSATLPGQQIGQGPSPRNLCPRLQVFQPP